MSSKFASQNKNRLWLARKQSGLEQKQVARLLNYKTTDQISRYERGERLPSLTTALKLEIIYQAPVGVLFDEHLRRYQIEIGKQLPTGAKPELKILLSEVCVFAALLEQARPSPSDLTRVREHVVALMRKMSYL